MPKGLGVRVLPEALKVALTIYFIKCYDELVKKFCGIFFLSIITFLMTTVVPPVMATSTQAYQDYLYQFDVYRQRFSDFRVALTQYQQFNSLASQQDALDKVKLLLAQRDLTAKTYLLFLNERLTENPGLVPTEAQLYRSIITNQIGFLDNHSVQAPSLSSLEDAQKSADAFAKNYPTLQSAYRQTIVAIELGYLNYFAQQFDLVTRQAQSLIAANKSFLPPTKQSTLDRWLLALSNKWSLYQQKATAIRTASFKLTGDVQEQDQLFLKIQSDLGQARQYLVEAVANLKELEKELQYSD